MKVIDEINEKAVTQIYDFIDPEVLVISEDKYNILNEYYKSTYMFNESDEFNIAKLNTHGFMLDIIVAKDKTDYIEVYGKRHKLEILKYE